MIALPSREIEFSLTQPQAEFVFAEEEFPAMVAGYGAGKTASLVRRMLHRSLLNPKGLLGFYEPTYDQITNIAVPEIEKVLEMYRIPFDYNQNKKRIYIDGGAPILFRSMEHPGKIVGYQTNDAFVDELDTVPYAKAKEAWMKIVARNRRLRIPGTGLNSVAVGTTPEGFKLVYELWKKEVREGYRLITASTYSNAHNLDPNYIPNLRKLFPPQLLNAYLLGLFVNLASGSVYPEFDRFANGTNAKPESSEALHIGLDFNVYKMAAAVAVIRSGTPFVVGEFANIRDTPAMIDAIRSRYGKNRSITIYPDASGQNTSSKGAGISDILQLQTAGFAIQAPSQNPPIRDRVAALNGLILNGTGQRRLKVNVDACPNVTECLEQQVYGADGKPDKTAGKDHHNDALGYLAHQRWPVGRSPTAQLKVTHG